MPKQEYVNIIKHKTLCKLQHNIQVVKFVPFPKCQMRQTKLKNIKVRFLFNSIHASITAVNYSKAAALCDYSHPSLSVFAGQIKGNLHTQINTASFKVKSHFNTAKELKP